MSEPPVRAPTRTGGATGTRAADFRIQGMDCPDCVRRIEDHLVGVEGVADAVGNPVSRRLRVEFDEARVDADRLRHEVGRLGYVARDADEPDEGGPETWRSPAAIRTYVSAGLFGLALALTAVGAAPHVVALPLADLELPGLLFVIAAAIGGWNFFPAAVRSVRTVSLDMNFLMTAAILGAVAVGEYLEAGAIAFLFSTAELLETWAVERARRSLEALMDLSPRQAVVIRDGREVTVAASEVEAGEVVVVRPGETIPADGTVIEGASAVDQSAITGESYPEERAEGDEVFAGTRALEGSLRVRVEKAADETMLARIVHLVEEAESRKAPSERFVQRFARWYTPTVTLAAVAVVALPTLALGGAFDVWFVRGLTLLVIACPCAFVISTPVAVISGITAAARNGVLIKGGTHLERLGDVDVLALDKTGTLTRGHPEVARVHPSEGHTEAEVLALARALESRSEHPLARAVVRAARARDVGAAPGTVRGFEALPGRGIRAELDGVEHRVGRPELFDALPAALERALHADRREGLTAVVVGRPEAPAGVLSLGDRARTEAGAAIARLREGGVRRVVMLTGDDRETADAIAREIGVDEVHADLLPDEKVERVRALEREHGAVAMVGDGVNDAPALAAASVGIAMGVAGSDVALETADVALMGDELGKLPYLFELSRRGRGVIRQNITASLGVKLALAVGVPLGAVSLIVAVTVGDMGASLGVTANAMRLARLRP